MRRTLMGNDLVRRDLGDISGYITRNIKYVGIATMIAVTGGYVLSKRYGKQTEQQPAAADSSYDEEQQED